VRTIPPAKSPKLRKLETLYAQVRELRQQGGDRDAALRPIFTQLQAEHSQECLLALEILEVAKAEDFQRALVDFLEELGRQRPAVRTLIQEGMELLQEPALPSV
jgi:hypothetical protein